MPCSITKASETTTRIMGAGSLCALTWLTRTTSSCQLDKGDEEDDTDKKTKDIHGAHIFKLGSEPINWKKKKEEYIVSAKNSRWGRGDNIVLEWAMIILHTLTVYTQCKVWTFLKIWISSFAKCGHFVTSVYQGMLKKILF